MKGDSSLILWKVLLLAFAISWAGFGMADAEAEKPVTMDSTTSTKAQPTSSQEKWLDIFDKWKLPETIQIHGFASQSYLRTTDNQFFGHTTNMGSLDFTEMGINGSWRPTSQLQTSMQVVYRRAGKTDNRDLRIDFGFLDYSFISDADKLLGVRLGRVVNPYGFYNDTRDMPFTRPSILLPQSVYFDVNRNFALSGDGAQVYGEYRTAYGDFFLQANGFYPRTNDPDLKRALAGTFPGTMEPQPSWVTRLMYELGAGQVRLGVTAANLVGQYEPHGGLQNLEDGLFEFSPVLFSAQYNAEKWSLTSEYEIRPLSLTGFGKLLPNTNITGESYYVQGSYRFLDNLEGFLRYDVLYWNTSDRNGQQYSMATGLPAYRRFAKDITTGLRWDITPSLMARIEYHYINGTGWYSALENINEIRDTSQHWSLFGASLSFRF